jgi:inner membrane transporter RhtA
MRGSEAPTAARSARQAVRRIGGSGPLLFVLSALSQYLGASLAVRAFSLMPAAGVAWVRVLTGTAVLAAWRRPWRHLRDQPVSALFTVALFGAVLAAMNLVFYLAIARLPLGTGVAIEFIGPVLVAAISVRSLRNLASFALAGVGVATLSRVSASVSVAGVAFALSAGVLWAAYIVLAHRVARRGLGTTGLAAAMAFGVLVIAPWGLLPAASSAGHGAVLLLAALVGLLSSALPYALDQLLLRRLARGTYAVLLSLLPATATLLGFLLLGQVPTGLELVGIALVVAAVAVRAPEEPAPTA